jgi:uncharacterized protein
LVVGVITWDLHVAGCQSLKDKRRVVKSLKDRLHRRLNVSVSETGNQDLWQRAELSCCVVAPGKQQAEKVITVADNLVGDDQLARIIESKTEFL